MHNLMYVTLEKLYSLSYDIEENPNLMKKI